MSGRGIAGRAEVAHPVESGAGSGHSPRLQARGKGGNVARERIHSTRLMAMPDLRLRLRVVLAAVGAFAVPMIATVAAVIAFPHSTVLICLVLVECVAFFVWA